MRIILLVIVGLCLCGCTITNLAPEEPDDGLLQRTLHRYNGKNLVEEVGL